MVEMKSIIQLKLTIPFICLAIALQTPFSTAHFAGFTLILFLNSCFVLQSQFPIISPTGRKHNRCQ